MKIRKKADEIWAEYQRGVSYNTGIGLYDNVERNNNFYNDKQWEGVNAPDLDKPVFNFLKPVVSYYIAMLISDDIAANIELATDIESTQADWANIAGGQLPVGGEMLPSSPQQNNFNTDDMMPKVLSQEIDNIIERTNMKFKNRKMIRNCAVDGDGCFYIWFDPDAPTGFDYKGEIKVDLIDNTNILFGNPTDCQVQEQPYILVAYRRLTEEVRDEARANGMNPDDITPDSESYYMNSDKDNENEYTTVLLKMWKEDGTVRIIKCTRDAIVKREADTEYKLYPLAYMNWESVKNCYHGVSPITGKIQNQIFVNKIYAMAMQNVLNNAFPKVMYDRTKVPAWNNKVGAAVAVAGNPNDAIFANFRAGDMSSDVMNMAGMTITQTKEMMGASDAALGNVRPDNTSAIIAVQKAAGMPLDIQRMDFYNFVESCVRIFIEIMRVNYGERKVSVTDSDGNRIQGDFNFSLLNTYAYNLKIDIGAGSYWSELMQVQTLDSLMTNNIIPDALTYLEAIPDGYIKNKNRIVEKIKEQQSIMQMAQQPLMPDEAEIMQAGEAGGMPPQGEEFSNTQGLDEASLIQIAQELAAIEDTDEQVATLDEMEITGEDKKRILDILGGTNND